MLQKFGRNEQSVEVYLTRYGKQKPGTFRKIYGLYLYKRGKAMENLGGWMMLCLAVIFLAGTWLMIENDKRRDG